MQSLRSRISEGTPFSDRQAEAASPEGPAPTMMGPWTRTSLHLQFRSFSGLCSSRGDSQEPIFFVKEKSDSE